MKTNKRKTKPNTTQKQQQQMLDITAPATSAPALEMQLDVPKSSLAQPMSAAEFLEELERQQEQRRPQTQGGRETEKLVEGILAGPAATGPQPTQNPRRYRLIKLGIDVHLDRYVVVRQIDGGAPQPAQRFSPAQFLDWVKKQTELADRVYSCYEAGPFGYSLHRKLTALGVTNYVVRPRDWDEYGQQVKTDKRDAKQLVLNLDRLVGGNREAFCVVRVPTEAEEQARSRSRQREALGKHKQRLAAQGRSDALYYGAHLEGEWWVEAKWKELAVPSMVLELLEPLRRLILAVEVELKAQTQAICAAAPQELPTGLGQLSYEVLEREVCNWGRFHNRRQVSSYTGMCPKEDSSADRRFQGSINKHGNPRTRVVLVEASWRFIRYQPTYKPVAKWLPILTDPKTTKSKRKQIVVAIGRQFSVDWWRVRTGRCQAKDLGLKLNPPAVVPSPRVQRTPTKSTKKK
jgi:transposase